MIAAWILHTLLVGFLLSVGALAVEHVVRAHRRPARWIWVATMVASVAWPVVLWGWTNRPASPPLALPAPDATAVAPLSSAPLAAPEPVLLQVAPDSSLRTLDAPILGAWALASITLFLLAVVLFVRTRRLQGGWHTERMAGREVLVSGEWGPAVVGFVRPQVVLPSWCRDLTPATLEYILAHEEEHIRAGDLRLLLTAGVAVVLLPWHLPLWWQLSRLRSAVEGDCDLRVLRDRPGGTRSYIELLLFMGRRAPTSTPMAALLSEPYQSLKRRIRIMTMPDPKRPWLRGGLLSATALLVVALACTAPPPTDAGGDPDGGDAGAQPASNRPVTTSDDGATYPTFTPFSVAPNGDNPDEVAAIMEREYAAVDDAPTGRVDVWYFVTEEGRVQDTRIARSSGSSELDQLALRAAAEWRFTPALNRDQPRAVWVSLPVIFGDGDTAAPAPPTEATAPAPRVVSSPALDEVSSEAGTGTVAGTVRDVASEQPLAFAQVFVPETGRGTLTDADGRFSMEGIPSGQRQVVVELVGYRRSSVQAAVGPTAGTVIEFPLQAMALELQPLVVR